MSQRRVIGGNSQDRRRQRRSMSRLAKGTPNERDLREIADLVATALAEPIEAAASGSTSLPLSDQNVSWDADAAEKGLSDAQQAQAHFWNDGKVYKLGFAQNVGGKLTAIWRGVTAAAGAIQGARGGVDIPEGDVAGVKANIASYYAKAAKQYGDDSIKPPWESASNAEALAHAEALGDEAVYEERLDFWIDQFETAEFGGEPNQGTKPDKRLKENKPGAKKKTPSDNDGDEMDALDAIDAFQAGVKCACGHAFSEHTGAGGTCGHEDGRGTCTCSSFAYPDPDGIATAYIKIRPDLSSFKDTFKEDLKTAIIDAFGEIFAPVAEMPEAAEVLPDESDEITPPEAPAASAGDIPWHATFIPEGKLTEDGRAFAPGSTLIPGQDEGARDLPLTLMAMIETSAEGGHDGAKVAGRIDSLYRDAPKVEADGVFSNEEWGQMIARMVENKELTGLSVDIAPLDYSWVPRDQFFNEAGDFVGVWDAEANDGVGEWAPAPGTEPEETEEEPSLMDIFFGEDDRVLLITKAVIGMATVCPFPAFGDAEIALTAAGMPYRVIVPLQMTMPAEALTAAGIEPCEECREAEIEMIVDGEPAEIIEITEPVLTAAPPVTHRSAPPAEWFANPEFDELTPLTITDDGRVYGHAWQWETCHLSFGTCVVAPHSKTEYAYFMTGEVACKDGERLQVGKITYDTGHAALRISRAEAIRHYDDTGTLACLVQFGEDEHGGWMAGAVVADMADEDLQRIRACGVSGDWRGIDGNLELVALLSVPVGGFPVPRGAVTASGDDVEPLSLVAAGVITDGRLAHIKQMIGDALIGDLTAE